MTDGIAVSKLLGFDIRSYENHSKERKEHQLMIPLRERKKYELSLDTRESTYKKEKCVMKTVSANMYLGKVY